MGRASGELVLSSRYAARVDPPAVVDFAPGPGARACRCRRLGDERAVGRAADHALAGGAGGGYRDPPRAPFPAAARLARLLEEQRRRRIPADGELLRAGAGRRGDPVAGPPPFGAPRRPRRLWVRT